ncbi:formate dehydrogenase accessory sulfurtransferase FdhD [Egicoccus sp. AB-alg6-2]|uniref:formate dehydrogenase accessory sulfurtransferase FdhD n=1 Tax=Egicoccus sp. AB-alg6-2 TaxID=3242692 RepID=UPI00359E1139
METDREAHDAGSESARASVVGAVLAGGRSSRMGRDKRFVTLDGQPLLARAVGAVAAVCDEVTVVVATAEPLPALPVQVGVVVDSTPGQGPLGGLITALETAAGDVVVVVAGDHPDLQPAVLGLLARTLAAADVDAVLLGDTHGVAQPLVGAYRRSAHAPLSGAFASGERRATAVLDHLDVLVLPPGDWRAHDPAGTTLVDLDTPDDVAAFVAGSSDGRSADTVPVTQLRHDTGRVVAHTGRDQLTAEEPLLIRAAGPDEEPVDLVTTMRSPGAEADLAIGWLVTEGLYDPRLGPATVRTGDPRELSRPEDTVTVRLPHPLPLTAAAHRHVMATASCGVCGRASIDELAARCTPLPPGPTGGGPAAEVLLALPDRLREAQTVFAVTGGTHATGLFTTDGRLVGVREDVGRHNALDAVIGAQVLARGMAFGDKVAVLSGRVGFELVAKAAAVGLPVIVAVGAPTDLAVRTADRLGITVVGFVRDGRGNVYTHGRRIRRA